MLIILLMERDKLRVQILLSNTMWSAKAAYRRQTAIIKASKCLYSLVQEVISKHNIFLRYLQAVSIFIEATQPKPVCDIEHPLLSLTQRGREQKSVKFVLSTSFFVLLSLHATESYRCFQIRRGNLLWGNLPMDIPRSGRLRTQKLRSHMLRIQSSKVLPLKPGVGQYITLHATVTARDFFLANFYPPGPFTCIFFLQNLTRVFPVLARRIDQVTLLVVTDNRYGFPR